MNEPIMAPTAKLGEKTEKILARVAGVEISDRSEANCCQH
jgi:hypothetical protein